VTRHVLEDPAGLTARARRFISVHGSRVASPVAGSYRERWLGMGVPSSVVDQTAFVEARWGGLLLPPALEYDGGPQFFGPDTPEASDGNAWWFEAGSARTALYYSFMIGPGGEFGIYGDRWVALHESVEGWVESLALEWSLRRAARTITRIIGPEVEDLSLRTLDPVTEVGGVTDSWWRDGAGFVSIYRGEAEMFSRPDYQVAYVYTDVTPEI
jgi:hypothetical protein